LTAHQQANKDGGFSETAVERTREKGRLSGGTVDVDNTINKNAGKTTKIKIQCIENKLAENNATIDPRTQHIQTRNRTSAAIAAREPNEG
jgi:hypothetical protein